MRTRPVFAQTVTYYDHGEWMVIVIICTQPCKVTSLGGGLHEIHDIASHIAMRVSYS